MTAKRMIHRQFFESEAIASLTIRQRLLVVGIITMADDQGRIKGHPGWLKAQIFPYDDISIDEINNDLEQIATNNDTIICYEADDKRYIQLAHWWEYQNMQWAKESNYPPPPEWNDRIRQMVYKPKRWVMTKNWPDTDDTLPLGNGLGNGAGVASGIVNTTTNTTIKTGIKAEEGFNAFAIFEQNIGLLTPALRDAIGLSIDEYGEGWCIEAIKKAAKMEKRSWAYCEGILRGWKRDGFNAARAPANSESQEAMFERLAREED